MGYTIVYVRELEILKLVFCDIYGKYNASSAKTSMNMVDAVMGFLLRFLIYVAFFSCFLPCKEGRWIEKCQE